MNNQVSTEEQKISNSESTSAWAKRRKLFFIFILVASVFIFGAYVSFKLLYTPPGCFNGKQDKKEVGVDCGGPCQNLCITQVSDVAVNWVKVFKVNNGVYSVAASIENPNKKAGVSSMAYTFKLYDKNGIVVDQREGNTFISARDRFIIFEPGIYTKNDDVPVKATITFDKSPVWKVSKKNKIQITVKNKKLVDVDSKPKLTATIVNNSISDVYNPEISAVVYDSKNKPIAVSSTFVDVINKNSQKDIFFTWPIAFTKTPKSGCTSPVDAILVFDRSGSMGFEGNNPSQPLTDSKDAAIEFIKNMQNVDQIGLVSFATNASSPIDQNLTKSHDKVISAVKSISILYPSKQQHTNLGDGIEAATLELLSDRHIRSAKKAIVVLTDGVASRPLNPNNKNDIKYPSDYAQKKARVAQDNDISIYVIGLGDNTNEEFLRDKIASSPSNYFKASTSSELKNIYNNIAKTICKEESFVTDIVIHNKDTGDNL